MEPKTLPNSVGIVETKSFVTCLPPRELLLKSGEKLGPITLAYETYGTLNADKSNAILVLHALTGDAHVAGFQPGDKKPGWWDMMVGPDKAFDTNKYFVICSNVLGGCKGSTGPSSTNPKTGKPYGMSFPFITISDMVNAQKLLINHLGIKKLLSMSGGSMGGCQVLEWVVRYPECVRSAIPIATTYRHSAQQIALQEVGRRAIMTDPDWQGGNYYGKSAPARGLSVARMLGHITYMSEKSMDERFGRKLFEKGKLGYDFESFDFEVENYLRYRGESFVQRFDANSYLYITKAIDYFDLTDGQGDLTKTFRGVTSKFLLISFASDWLYPSYQMKDIGRALKANNIDVSDIVINSDYGHDAFLVEDHGQAHMIKNFLARVERET